jgi:hypothetical protein
MESHSKLGGDAERSHSHDLKLKMSQACVKDFGFPWTKFVFKTVEVACFPNVHEAPVQNHAITEPLCTLIIPIATFSGIARGVYPYWLLPCFDFAPNEAGKVNDLIVDYLKKLSGHQASSSLAQCYRFRLSLDMMQTHGTSDPSS